MPTGWGGADPTAAVDPNGYELGVEYIANADLTITSVRLWGGPSDVSVTNRLARIWSTSGVLLGTATLPNVLTAGWASYPLLSNVTRVAGARFVVSYTTGGNYGQVVHALDSSVNSADNNVTAVGFATSTNGNGVFSTNQTQFPTTASGNHTFYGADFVYSLGIGGPAITNLAVTAVGFVATATTSATDSGAGLAGAVYRFDWGDGSSPTSGSSNTASHTYAANGVYAILASITDTNSLSAYAAQPVVIQSFPGGGFDALGLIDALVSMAQSSGLFTAVSGHEPASLPASGLAAAVWMQGIGPLKKLSGLAATAARVELRMRIYTPMVTGNMDSIDPTMTEAASEMIRRLSADFTLDGEIFAADLLGAQGAPLSAKADYYKQGDTFYRIYDITVPLMVDDVWAQAGVA